MKRLISNNASIRHTTLTAIGERGISFLPAALRRAFSSRSAASSAGHDDGVAVQLEFIDRRHDRLQ
jgi:hypothetical protein